MKAQFKVKNFPAAYSAALWAFIFAFVHLAWACGWYVGLDKTAASRAFERKWFLIYDVIAAVLCGLAAAIALAFVYSRREQRFSYAAVGVCGWCCTGILTLRGCAAILRAVYLITSGENPASNLSFWDLWFCLGAVLFAAGLWRFQHGNRKSYNNAANIQS